MNIKNKKNWKFKLGLTLVIISIPVFLSIPLLPFILEGASTKVTFTTIVLIIAEVLFWSGGLMLGKELSAKYKAHMNPFNWFKQKEKLSR